MSFLSALVPARFRAAPTAAAPLVETGLRVVEGVESVWSYHLAHGPTRQALCNPGRTMMQTGIPLSGWGYKSSHLPEKYCAECARIAAERNLGTLGPAATP